MDRWAGPAVRLPVRRGETWIIFAFASSHLMPRRLWNTCKVKESIRGKVQSRYGAEGDGPSLYVTDPERNVVELKGPPWKK